MRPNQLLSSLYLAQAALAAPILLVAGSSAKAVFIRPARQMAVPEVAQVVFNADDKPAPKPSTTVETNPASLLGSDSPLTTAQLMAIAQVKSTPEVPPPPQQEDEESTQSTILMTTSTTTTSSKGKVSVGTLVVPGSRAKKAPMSQVFDGKKAPSLYLVPGYYISSRQADIFVVGIILAFVLAVLAVETCGPVSRTVTGLFRRPGAIRLEDSEDNPKVVKNIEDGCDDNDDDDDMAPFGAAPYRHSSQSLRLPEKVDEKAGMV